MEEHDEGDYIESKQRSLITGAPYTTLDQDRKGVMTLCFEKGKSDHASLVFEYFSSKNPHEISLSMVHCWQEDDGSCFKGKKEIRIESRVDTLKKVYRAVKKSTTESDKYVPATYTRYASWILPNDQLMRGVAQAEEDTTKNESYSPIGYVSKIMKVAGLNSIDFSFLTSESESNLKDLVDKFAQPRPKYTVINLPNYEN